MPMSAALTESTITLLRRIRCGDANARERLHGKVTHVLNSRGDLNKKIR